jgi:hypothetical protein
MIQVYDFDDALRAISELYEKAAEERDEALSEVEDLRYQMEGQEDLICDLENQLEDQK